MTVSQSDLNVGRAAARQWLNANEGMYSGMISDQILNAVVAAVVNAVDANRKAHTPHANNG